MQSTELYKVCITHTSVIPYICYYVFYMGSEKQSIAAKGRWSKIPKEQRIEMMYKAHKGRKKKWKDTPKPERSEHGRQMVMKRWGKDKEKGTA